MNLNEALADVYYAVFEYFNYDPEDFIDQGYSLRSNTICHDGDSNGFVYYINNGCWKCFTHNCDRIYGNKLVDFIMLKANCNEKEACKIAFEILKQPNKPIDRAKFVQPKITNYFEVHEKQSSIDDSKLSLMPDPIDFLNTRKLDLEICNKLQIKYSDKLKRIIVPVRDINSNLVGVTARTLGSINKYNPKWIHQPAGFKTSLNIFNIDNVAHHLKLSNCHTIVLAEGPFDVIKFLMAGIKQVGAILGCNLSTAQISLLKHLNITDVIIAADNDSAGGKAAQANKIKLERELFNVKIMTSVLKDFGETNPEDINKMVRSIL